MQKKKIKKLKNKKDSTHLQLQECSIKTLSKLQRPIPLNFIYKLPGELYISDQFPLSNKAKEFMNNHNYFKRLIAVKNDQQMQLVSCQLIDYPCIQPPLSMLIQRLQTIGNVDAYNLSKTLEVIHLALTTTKKETKTINIDLLTQTEAYKKFVTQNERVLKQQSKYFNVVWRSSNQDDVNFIKTFEIAFDYKFINLMGFTNENFIQNLFKNGLPECFYIEGSFFKILNWILTLVFLNYRIEEELQYIIKTNWKDFKVRSIEIINKFESENYIELFSIQSFEVNQADGNILAKNISKNISINASYEVNRNNNKNKQYNLIVESDYFREDIQKWLKYYYPDFNIINIKKSDDYEKLRCQYINLT